jgi:hypothetical protein
MNRKEFLPSRLRHWLTVGVVAVMAASGSVAAQAAPVDDAVVELQRDWEVIRYQSPAAEREKRFEALAAKSHKVSETYPARAEPLVWEGIIVSSWAGEKGGLGALGLVKQAKAPLRVGDRHRWQRPGRVGLQQPGVLYYKVPGWPVGFGDKAKAKELLQKALAINPQGIDPNFFYGEYLVESKQPDQAVALSRARDQRAATSGATRWPTPDGAKKRERCSTR